MPPGNLVLLYYAPNKIVLSLSSMFHVLYLIVNMTDTNNNGSIQGTMVHMGLAMKALKKAFIGSPSACIV